MKCFKRDRIVGAKRRHVAFLDARVLHGLWYQEALRRYAPTNQRIREVILDRYAVGGWKDKNLPWVKP